VTDTKPVTIKDPNYTTPRDSAGKPAEKAFKTYSAARDGQHADWVACLHPSPRNKATRPERWPEIEAVFVRAAEIAATS